MPGERPKKKQKKKKKKKKKKEECQWDLNNDYYIKNNSPPIK